MSHYYDLDPSLASKENKITLEIYSKKIELVTDNGVFSKKRIDEGSFAFLKVLLPLSLGKNILDLGCGYGTLGLTIALFNKDARVTLADVNTRALALCKKSARNLEVESRVTILQSDVYENIEGPYDSIVINPPIRAGKKVTYAMYEGAKQRLTYGGSLFIVIRKAQGALSAKEYITELFGNCTLLERHKGYHIYQAKKTNEEI